MNNLPEHLIKTMPVLQGAAFGRLKKLLIL